MIGRTCRNRWLAALALAVVPHFGHAGMVEDLLAVPAIQSLLGRAAELQAMVQKCGDPGYAQRNQKLCQQVQQVSLLVRIAPELRVLLANPNTAVSIRQLCLAVQGNPAQNSYLCTELSRADASFNLQAAQQREAVQYQQRQDIQIGK